MKTKKAHVTLDSKEVIQAVKHYYQSLNTGKDFHGNFDIYKSASNSNQFSVSFDVSVSPGIDITNLHEMDSGSYCKLRHKASKLFLNVVRKENNATAMLCDYNGRIFDDLPEALEYIRKVTAPYSQEPLSDDIKDRLLQFEVVNFGEQRVDDMTFHIDVLGKV
jgi:hypothetical protein